MPLLHNPVPAKQSVLKAFHAIAETFHQDDSWGYNWRAFT